MSALRLSKYTHADPDPRLRSTNNGSALCVTETLDNLEPYTGTLSFTNIESIVTTVADGGSVPNVPTNVTCTDCVKGAYSLIAQSFGDLLPDTVKSGLTSECGASFVGASSPRGIRSPCFLHR